MTRCHRLFPGALAVVSGFQVYETPFLTTGGKSLWKSPNDPRRRWVSGPRELGEEALGGPPRPALRAGLTVAGGESVRLR